MSLVQGHTYWLILALYAVVSCQLSSLNMAKLYECLLTGGNLHNIPRFLKVNRRGLGLQLTYTMVCAYFKVSADLC